jgi:hypothetical protein
MSVFNITKIPNSLPCLFPAADFERAGVCERAEISKREPQRNADFSRAMALFLKLFPGNPFHPKLFSYS